MTPFRTAPGPPGDLLLIEADCFHNAQNKMAGIHHWSVSLASGRSCRPRWLTENGTFSSNPARALRLVNPDVAAQRVQAYMAIRGWPHEVMERFRLVPSPPCEQACERAA